MTETEKKALALLNAVCAEWEVGPATEDDMDGSACFAALARAVEQHEAFKREVSDAVEGFYRDNPYEISCYCDDLKRFIIAKTDPLVEALDSLGLEKADEWAPDIRKALAARGGRIVWEGE